MLIKDIRIVDMRKSKIDVKKSHPERDEYVFIEKVYLPLRPNKMLSRNPDYKLKWGKKGSSQTMFADWGQAFGATPVIPEDNLWPEGLRRDENGHYSFKDTVLVKIPLDKYLDKREKDIQASDRKQAGIRKQLEREYGDAALSEQEVADYRD
jgi:hypothetical protein